MLPSPDYHSHEEFKNRSQKLEELRRLGVDPYPHKFTPSHTAAQVQKEYGSQAIGHSEDAAAGTTPFACIAGRLMLFRGMGKNAFAHIQDEAGKIQVMFNKDLTQVTGYSPDPSDAEALSPFKLLEKKVDLGDLLGLEGHLFHTNKGELTLFVKKATILCKTLLPLPDKHGGLADKELRYRKRWLDLITHPEVRDTFRLRSRIISIVRHYCEEAHFLEVETPVLQSIYGGASARPFLTHLNALEQQMFMRISLEIPLKKLLVGGMGRVFEIGKVFRNEGIDRSHNPEFTELECYAAYWDYNDLMVFMENLLERIAIQLTGSTKVSYGSQEDNTLLTVDFKAPWKRMTMKESIKEYGNMDVDRLSDVDIRRFLEEECAHPPKELAAASRGLLISLLFEELVEKHLVQPHHITDHPIETTPLCKPHRRQADREEGLVERFESFVIGQELCNAYSELNDPQIQRKLLVQQAERREAGDEEAMPLDEEFIEAICQGMPPAAGLGIGIDRLVMLFTNAHSIRDVLYFPIMKPEKTTE